MKNAKSLDVFGLLVPVDFMEDLQKEIDADGQYCAINKTIKIDESLEGLELDMTMIHELGHAIFDRIGLGQGVSKEFEETVVDSFATCLAENFIIKPR